MDAILPAGGRVKGAFAAEVGTQVKALFPLGERTLLERTLVTLRATERVRRAVVVGPAVIMGHPAARGADAVLPEGGSAPANILRGIDWLAQEASGGVQERVLIVATDLPFLTPEAVIGFLDACPEEADIAVPIISKEAIETRFPGTRRRYVRLREGRFVIGCIFLVNPEALARNRVHLERVFAARKAPLLIMWMLGPAFVAQALAGALSLDHIRERCEKVLGCRGSAVQGCAPEVAYDIDRLRDYYHALAHHG